MTEIHKRYRLTSTEEPTDEMLHALMEDVAQAARESSAKAEAEKKRRLQAVAKKLQRKPPACAMNVWNRGMISYLKRSFLLLRN